MENRIQRLFLNVLFVAHTVLAVQAIPALAADDKAKADQSNQVIVPELQRREIEKPNIDSLDIEVGLYYGLLSIPDFGTNPAWGGTLAFHVTEDFFLEGEYGTSEGDETSFEKLSGSAQLLDDDDRNYNYYSVSVGWNVLPGEVFIGSKRAFPSSLYLIGGIGGTEFAGDSEFTINVGIGYRLLINDWFAVRVDARDYVFERDVFGEEERTHNLELRTGFTVFF